MPEGTPARGPAPGSDGILKVVLLYAAFAALWILLSDKAVEWLFRESAQITLASTVKGWLFVAVTSLLLYGLMRRLLGRTSAELAPPPVAGLRPRLSLALIAVAIIVLTAGSIVNTFRHEKDKELARLQAIADLKAGQIADWLRERDRDGHFVQSSRFFAETYRQWRYAGDTASGDVLKKRLNEYREDRSFQGVLLLDEQNEVLWDSEGSGSSLNPALQAAASQAAAEGRALRVGPYLDANGRPRIDLVAPLLLAGNHQRPVVVLRIDPAAYLFPTLQAWPVPSASGGMLLFWRDGDDVVFLNEHRHRKETGAMLRIPVTERDLLTAQVLRGVVQPGKLIEGVDHWGVPVMGVARAIPGTDWFLLAKMDQAEARLDVNRDAPWIILTGLFALFMVVAGAFLFRQHQQLLFSLQERETQAEKLRALELLDAIARSSGDAIYAKDKEGRYLLFNREAARLSGRSPQEVVGLDDTAIFPPEQAASVMADDRKVMEGNRILTVQEDLTTVDGEITFLATKGPLHDAAGNVIGCFGISHNITERKRAEEIIAKERTLSEDIISSLPGIFYMYDDKGKLVRWNKKHEEATGYSSEEMLGMYVLDWFSEEHKQYILSRVRSVFAEGESLAEAPLLIKNGSQIPYFFTGRLATLDGKQYLVGVGIDITERKRSEAERALLATAVEQAEENVLVTDDRRTILYINPAFERSSGYRSEDLKGHKLRVLRSAQHDEAFYRNMKEILDRGEVWMGVIINKGKDGTDFEIEGTISPLRDASGSLTHFVAAGRNMSRFRKLERELYQAQKMESVGRLAGGVAHDFNNMLGVILGHAELALREVDSAQTAHNNLQEILKAAHRSANLIRQLLAFARKQTISPKVLDINETVGSMLKMVRRLIGEDVELLWKPGVNVWPVKVDPTQIDQILANLCVNARDAIAGVGKVIIATGNMALDEAYCREHPGAFSGEYVLLAVSDNGCGMEKGVLDKLFEPFFTTKEVGKGTGLGLATVYGIVKQNNGFIDVQSAPGRGTTFHIYLPRTDVPISEEQGFQEQNQSPRGTETVLLVEDEESLLELGKTILEHHGYLVLAARNPAEALNLAKSYPGRIDLLVTDVIMPGMNGKELTEKLSAFKAGFRSIFMSGYTGDVLAQHGVLDEGIDFLQKPFSVKSLAEKVREVLET
jgi:two-component system, cell cycle sensor histidine kinase and response regulator CckA